MTRSRYVAGARIRNRHRRAARRRERGTVLTPIAQIPEARKVWTKVQAAADKIIDGEHKDRPEVVQFADKFRALNRKIASDEDSSDSEVLLVDPEPEVEPALRKKTPSKTGVRGTGSPSRSASGTIA